MGMRRSSQSSEAQPIEEPPLPYIGDDGLSDRITYYRGSEKKYPKPLQTSSTPSLPSGRVSRIQRFAFSPVS